MKKKTILKFILLVALFFVNFLMFFHLQTGKRRNEGLRNDFSEMKRITAQPQSLGKSSRQSAESIRDILQRLNASVFLKNFETRGDIVHLQLNGISQEQLFGFFKDLSKKVKHQIIQCDISQNGADTLILIIEIQIL